MKIRKADINDVEYLFLLENKFNEEHNNIEEKDFRVSLNKNNIKNNFEKKINQKKSIFLVLEKNNKVIGYLFGEITVSKSERYGYEHNHIKKGYLENVFIDKKYRGKGYYKELFDQFIDYLKSKKIKYCELHVNANNNAKQLYEKQGFSVIEYKMLKKI